MGAGAPQYATALLDALSDQPAWSDVPLVVGDEALAVIDAADVTEAVGLEDVAVVAIDDEAADGERMIVLERANLLAVQVQLAVGLQQRCEVRVAERGFLRRGLQLDELARAGRPITVAELQACLVRADIRLARVGCDALVIPGGRAPEYLRLNEEVMRHVG